MSRQRYDADACEHVRLLRCNSVIMDMTARVARSLLNSLWFAKFAATDWRIFRPKGQEMG